MRLLILPLLAIALRGQTPPAGAPQNPASVSGRVTAVGGQAVRKAQVSVQLLFAGTAPSTAAVTGSVGQQPSYAAVTDADGRFAVQGLAEGSYIVNVDHPAYLHTAYGAQANGFGNPLVALKAGQSRTDLNVVMTPQSSISGRILDEDGEPAAHIQVSAMSRIYLSGGRGQYTFNSRASTDENGDYKLGNLKAGKYLVTAGPSQSEGSLQNLRAPAADIAKAEQAAITTFYPGAAHLTDAIAVDVGAGQDRAGTNMRLIKAPVFHVRGKATGDLPLAMRVRVAVMPKEMGMAMTLDKSAIIDKDGSFDVRGVSPGAYNVSLMNSNGMIQLLATQPVQVGNEDVNNVILQAAQPVTLHGTIRMDGTPKQQPGNPAAQAQGQDANRTTNYRISLLAMDSPGLGAAPRATAKDDGIFTLDRVSVGTYQVIANAIGPAGGYVKSIKLAGREMIDSGLIVGPAASGPLEILLSTDGGEIDGAVKTRDGNPAPRGMIVLVPENPTGRPDLYRQGVSGDSGQFRLMNVPPGKYRVYSLAQSEPAQMFDPDFLRTQESASERVTVEDNGKVQVTLTR